ncbi:MAG: amylo-alpha-1,6-glucosidase [Bacteroidetes bacterium RIFOXYA12_FULL_35_11]|nr:MAG: amylo-alpha-1,6-glucosidase [Bacteroidetes bacterium GWF2_35_48]OFY82979.1 MAG: amylo-alpha-1,6-glucosidase [Bacteroidetes bacterium RIFOXYA12_FULL_35_11]OFY96156.1 MAG: amylo-alpha-1,6-glucosidase [Bacteroidetes bacterium RIFOXYB2_FULL_35_7]HBX49505.1 amylo-alpha-1,6-glucosidase [Bacteroidales bacterium]
MSYLNFDKTQLINLEYSLKRELIRSNRAGSYASTTIVGCNTRKYHGLLCIPLPHLDGGKHVLLSALDETVIQHDASFNLGIRKYPGTYEPRGHKYIRDYESEPIPAIIYRVGGVLLKKEMLLSSMEDKVLIRYTLLEAHSPTKLRFKPFMAFRNIHALSKANLDVNTNYFSCKNGIRLKLYYGYPELFMQFSKKVEYVPVPHWYYNIEYHEEQKRGYEYLEDLYVPGYFETSIKKGESIVFAAGVEDSATVGLIKEFDKEISMRIPRSSFEHCLINSAQQFIYKRNKKTDIVAGFPWYGRWGRDTFIALPGLTLCQDDKKTCKDVLDTMSSEMKGFLFSDIGVDSVAECSAADAPLWFIWAIQQYNDYTKKPENTWKEFGAKIKKILKGYREGKDSRILMHKNGLIYAGQPGKALTWMDAEVHGKPITQRMGYAVEIQALWYNAVCFSIALAKKNKDNAFVKEWSEIPELCKTSFNQLFWDPTKGHLADYVDGEYKDWTVRPNQVFATSMEYSMIADEIKKAVLDNVEADLLTPRGLRTLTPKSPLYKGIYEGNPAERDEAYHQGAARPWLLGHFAEGYLKLYGKAGISFIEKIVNGFEKELTIYGVGTIGELFDGDPPHEPKGAVSLACSVGELLRVGKLISVYKKMK